MLVFEVRVNDGPPTVAGLQDVSVLAATITYVHNRDDLELRVGGMTSNVGGSSDHAEWIVRKLRTGDEVTLRVATGEAHPPTNREPVKQAENEKLLRNYYYELKKRFEPSEK
jgi:hypothetical protein